MIDSILIKNFALIKQSELEFKNGFNVLVGETGAGKTITLSAILFVLGQKTDKTIIRTGENSTNVQICFSNVNEKTINLLNENAIDFDGDLIISRTMTTEGKNDCRINGQMVTLTSLKAITDSLVDCYQQHESVEMLKVKNHIQMLDNYKPELLKDLKTSLSAYQNQINEIDKQLSLFGGDERSRENLLDLLNYQIKEIDDACLIDGEDIEIAEKMNFMNSAEKLQENFSNILQSLDGNSSSLENVKLALSSLHNIVNIKESYSDFYNRLSSVKYEIEDIVENIKEDMTNLDFSQVEYERLDARQDKIKSLKKKYGSTINEINAFNNECKEKRNKLTYAESEIEKLESDKKIITNKALACAKELSIKRQNVAKEIELKIVEELRQLGMKNASFKVLFKENSTLSKNGIDDIEFLFSANSGEQLKSLSKTISGGELSRFMLAVKNILADNAGVQSLIFDEVDSGVSGQIGGKVAEKIANLSTSCQIICITHLPQVTAMADNYILIKKQTSDGKTYSTATCLNESEKIEYIAKLVSADITTGISLEHAKQLKQWGDNYKKNIKNE